MAIIDLGKVSITWRGTYAGGTAYTPKDAVVYNNASYICIANTTGNLPTDTTYWNVMAAKGVDGTDVGTTLTTQGDILYRDGSGLQRLAAGTAGHVLQTGGSGANPSWTAVSSDFVKIATVDNDNVGAGSYNFDNAFTEGTYQSYKLDLVWTASADEHLQFRYLDSSGSVLTGGSDYRRWGVQAYRKYSDNSSNTIESWSSATGSNSFHLTGWNQPSGTQNAAQGITLDFMLPYPTTKTSQFKTMFSRSVGYSTSSWGFMSTGGHYYTGNSAVRGFQIYVASGNITKLYATLYGIKK